MTVVPIDIAIGESPGIKYISAFPKVDDDMPIDLLLSMLPPPVLKTNGREAGPTYDVRVPLL